MASTIPARCGKAVHLKQGQKIKVINTHGTQVVDTWAFNEADMKELMSMEHSRSATLRMIPKVGDKLVTNKRRPILKILEDTCPIHDTLMSACDIYRYQGLGVKGYHDSCTDNLHKGLKEIGLEPPEVPSPFNLWMNVPWTEVPMGALKFVPPASKPGDYIVMEALMDVVMAFSACPQDVLPINGTGTAEVLSLPTNGGDETVVPKFAGQIKDCHFEILD